MKRKLIFLLSIIFSLMIVLPIFASCNSTDYLKIANVADYIWIDEESENPTNMIDRFKQYYREITGRNIKVFYDSSFLAPEGMMTKSQTSDYDLICPSDYVIEKMINLKQLKPLATDLGKDVNGNQIEDYRHQISPLIENRLEFDPGFKYSYPYMWGTVGISFNRTHLELMAKNKPELLNDVNENGYPDIVESWDILWDKQFKGRIMMKNSQRDAFMIAAIHQSLSNGKYKSSADQQYPDVQTVYDIINNSSISFINQVKQQLIEHSYVSYGLEGDEGKIQVITNEKLIGIPQWGGDAFYSITEAKEYNKVMDYYVPNEGSSIFCDAWCIPKNAKNDKAANLFINFMAKPEIAIDNMDYIGYNTCCNAPEVIDYLNETYAEEDEIDLSYFIGGDTPIYVKVDTRQFPDLDTINRCAPLKAFSDEAEQYLTNAWIEFIASQM